MTFCHLESFIHYVVFVVILVSPLINCDNVHLLTYLKLSLADGDLNSNEIQLLVKQLMVPSYRPSASAAEPGSRRSEENLVNAKSLKKNKFHDFYVPLPQTVNPVVSPGKLVNNGQFSGRKLRRQN